jgi:hypothetical protein
MRRVTYKVTVDVPDSLTNTEMAEYIKDEVDSGGGNREPLDPLFLKKNTVVKIHNVKGSK